VDEPSLGQALDERDRLVAVAFRLLGTRADAEDAVQEAYARWYRLTDTERDAVRRPGAWLTTVVSRVCLDQLGSARAHRERYVGPWLPEPVPDPDGLADPADRVTLDDEVTSAVMVLLESLTPAERVSFVLHDVFGLSFDEVAEVVGRSSQACRKLASAARADIRARRERQASPQHHDRVVRAFLAACATGDVARLLPLLDPDVALASDGGGVVRAARNVVRGPDRVARFLLGLAAKDPSLAVEPAGVEGRTGVLVRRAGQVVGVVSFDVRESISDVWVVVNPDKLGAWA
jgi:RNA polymerase sigma-70 factor (ECF subfamily)